MNYNERSKSERLEVDQKRQKEPMPNAGESFEEGAGSSGKHSQVQFKDGKVFLCLWLQ